MYLDGDKPVLDLLGDEILNVSGYK